MNLKDLSEVDEETLAAEFYRRQNNRQKAREQRWREAPSEIALSSKVKLTKYRDIGWHYSGRVDGPAFAVTLDVDLQQSGSWCGTAEIDESTIARGHAKPTAEEAALSLGEALREALAGTLEAF